MFKSLKTSTNRMTNEEQLQSRFSSNLASFLFFLSLLSLQSFSSGPQNLPLSPFSCLFIAKQGIWSHDNSPRRAGYFIMKLYGGLGEPEASLGELVFRKSLKMTLLHSPLVIFASLIKTLNDHLLRTVTGV